MFEFYILVTLKTNLIIKYRNTLQVQKDKFIHALAIVNTSWIASFSSFFMKTENMKYLLYMNVFKISNIPKWLSGTTASNIWPACVL